MVDQWIFKLCYMAIMVVTSVIRWPHQKRNKNNQIANDQKSSLEKSLLFAVSLGMMLLPLLYIFSPILVFADYSLPIWAQAMGILLSIPSLWLFYRSHKDLGQNWSVSLEVREGHTLVTAGIYKYVRHPMYTAIWLWVFAQPFLLTNFIAGLSGIITFGLLYFFRVNSEEQMMLKQFGEQYKNYMQQTNRLIPKI
ncbi:MAG: protein-S-isoprenylcysteine O-methyltransferase [Bacteroidota bacterium]